MWSNKAALSASQGLIPRIPLIRDLGVLCLVLLPPIGVFALYHCNQFLDGSWLKLVVHFYEHKGGWLNAFWSIVPSFTKESVVMLAAFALFELVLLKFLPGKTFKGPITPGGVQPVYQANGLQAYFVTLVAYVALLYFGVIPLDFVYRHYGSALLVLNVFSLLFVAFLVVKGHLWPSGPDCGSSGSLLFDYYWGYELHPSIWGVQIKQFTNCRFGLMAWILLVISFAGAQYQQFGYVADSMVVNLVLQFVYVTKFFYWETGYLASIDIILDRAGFMICWGCLCWVPSLYVSHSFYLAHHPVTLGWPLAALVLAIGALSVIVNFWSDEQRAAFRRANGKTTIWGKPAEYIVAEYTTESGDKKTSLLLCNGFWGIARHFQYIPELMAAFLWSCVGGFTHFMPFSYFAFLCVLLFDRAYRDDAKCRCKYGKHWDKYCERVPYRFIPGIW